VKHRFIEEQRQRYGVKVLCEALQVSRSGYYAARCRPVSARRQRQVALTARIRDVHTASRETYGAPRVHAELRAQGVACCRNTVAKLMRQAQIVPRSVQRFRVTTDSRNTQASADLLQRRFEAQQPNQCWLSDVTYIPTREGWLYLAAVEDLYSRRVVGWSMADRLESRLVVDALALAVERRLPGEGLLAHSDRGSQYASDHYQRLLARHGITCSMSRRADCWDNAPMESFFASLKKELIHGADFATRAEARAAIVEYIKSLRSEPLEQARSRRPVYEPIRSR